MTWRHDGDLSLDSAGPVDNKCYYWGSSDDGIVDSNGYVLVVMKKNIFTNTKKFTFHANYVGFNLMMVAVKLLNTVVTSMVLLIIIL